MYVTQEQRLGATYRKTLSWRTGNRVAGQPIIPKPSKSGGQERLEDTLKARKRYLELVDANVSENTHYNGYALTGDTGHIFDTIKFLVPQFQGSYQVVNHNTGKADEKYPTTYRAQLPLLEADRTYGASLLSLGDLGYVPWDGPPLPSLGNWRSAAYADAALESASMGWGETVVELVLGNYPKLLSSLFERIKKGRLLDPKGYGKDLGSEYLNAQFGIAPILRDIQTLILHLSGISDGLYGEYSRKRNSPRESVYYNSSNMISYRNSQGASSTRVRSPGDVHLWQDERITMKLVKARPTIAANSFLEKANEVHRQLGFDKPSLGWDVIPWSWLIDWVSNIGSSIDNASYYSAQSGTSPASYSYVTTKRVTHVQQYIQTERRSGDYTYYTLSSDPYATCTRLTRNRGTPFGFNFSMPSLSTGQWAILVALGLAKRP